MSAVGGRIPPWKASGKAKIITLDKGFVYIHREAIERYGLDFFIRLNGGSEPLGVEDRSERDTLSEQP